MDITLKWDGYDLRRSGRVLASIEPNPKWPGMWRVRTPGVLTDMVNLTRARDAARLLALAALDRQYRVDTTSTRPRSQNVVTTHVLH